MKILANENTVPSSIPELYHDDGYRRYVTDLLSQRLLVAILFAGILLPAATLFDFLIFPDLWRVLLPVRLFATLACIFLGILAFKTPLKRHPLLACHLTSVAVSGFISHLAFLTGAYASPYYAGLILIFICIGLFLPWKSKNVFFAGLTMLSVHFIHNLGPSLLKSEPINWSQVWNSVYFLSFTFIMAVYIAEFLERSRQQVYVATEREKRRAQSLEDSKNEIERLTRLKGEFIANITHELKTPLAIVVGNADLIVDSLGDSNQESTGLALQIQQASMQLSSHVDRILSMSASDNAELKMNLDSYDYTGIARHIYSLFESQAVARSIAYGFVAPERHLIIHADMILIEEVLRNLVQNAFKFTPDNGTITVTISSDGEKVFTEVSDTGTGIAPEKTERIFERLYQADNVLSKRHGGLGLGLFIVKRNVELHGGAITVHSVVDKGTTFRFELPLHIDQSVQAKNLPWEGENRRSSNDRRSIDRRAAARAFEYRQSMGLEWLAEMSTTANLAEYQNLRPDRATVLVAEDNPGMMKVLVEALRSEYNLLLAFNGVEALAKLGDHSTSVSLILTDIMMPELNGYDFCAKVMEHQEWKHIPLIFISALMSDEDKLRGYRLGATDYLVKPYNVKILQEKVAHWIGRRNHEQLLKTMSESLEQRAQQLARVRDIIIHEIRNPLTIINGANFFMNSVAQSAVDHSQHNELRKYVDMLQSGIEAMEGVLDCTRELDMQNLGETAAVPIQQLIDDAIAHTRHFFSDIKLTVSTQEAQGYQFLCNRQMIVQVFVNLIRNAVDAIREKDSGEVGMVTLSAAPLDHGQIQISIRDNGIGMSDEIRDNLFQFKYTTKKNGTGIGLHLSKMMLKLHEASITVESTPGEGSVFHLYLPVVNNEIRLDSCGPTRLAVAI